MIPSLSARPVSSACHSPSATTTAASVSQSGRQASMWAGGRAGGQAHPKLARPSSSSEPSREPSRRSSRFSSRRASGGSRRSTISSTCGWHRGGFGRCEVQRDGAQRGYLGKRPLSGACAPALFICRSIQLAPELHAKRYGRAARTLAAVSGGGPQVKYAATVGLSAAAAAAASGCSSVSATALSTATRQSIVHACVRPLRMARARFGCVAAEPEPWALVRGSRRPEPAAPMHRPWQDPS